MKKTLIVCTCVFNVVLNLIPAFTLAATLDMPDDYREHANQIEFLTHLARRCDTRLSILGKKALADGEPCRTCMTRTSVMVVAPATLERWKAFVRAVAQSSDQVTLAALTAPVRLQAARSHPAGYDGPRTHGSPRSHQGHAAELS